MGTCSYFTDPMKQMKTSRRGLVHHQILPLSYLSSAAVAWQYQGEEKEWSLVTGSERSVKRSVIEWKEH